MEPFVVLADINISQNIDFIATSFAANTHCTSIQDDCFKNPANESAFDCSIGNFNRSLAVEAPDGGWNVGYLANQSYTYLDSMELYTSRITSNYSWILVASLGDEELVDVSSSTPAAFAYYCNTSIWNVTYSVSNGNYSIMSKESSNRLTALSLTGAITSTNVDFDIISPDILLQERFTSIALSNSSLADKVDQFALEYSALTMSFAAGIVTPIFNQNESLRTTSLVTQLSSAPFFTLLELTAIYAIGGISLAIAALYTRRHTTHKLQSLLSLSGITAAASEQGSIYRETQIEDIADRYEEMATCGKFTSRICVEEAVEGYWQFGEYSMFCLQLLKKVE